MPWLVLFKSKIIMYKVQWMKNNEWSTTAIGIMSKRVRVLKSFKITYPGNVTMVIAGVIVADTASISDAL